MRVDYLTSLALAAASVSALPSHVEYAKREGDINSEGVVTKTPPAPTAGPSCDYKVDRESIDSIKKLIDYTAFPSSLDINLNIERNRATGWADPDGWLNKYYKLNFPKDQTATLDGCGSITSDCDLPIKKCKEYPNANAYWIFLSVKAIHDKLQSAQTKLFQKTFIASLSIDQMKKDFDVPKPDNTWLKWVGVGLAFAGNVGTISSAAPAISAGIGVASNFFFFPVANDNVANVDTAKVEEKLGNILEGVSNYMSDTLSTVMGNKKYPYDKLPNLAGPKLNNSISHVIADPSWLIGDSKDESSLGVVFDKFSSNIVRHWSPHFSLFAPHGAV